MFSVTYYLIIGALRLPPSNSPRWRGTVRFSLSFSLIRVPIPSLFEFELNNVRIPISRVARSSGTGTTWIGINIGTNPVLVSGTGTTLSWYRYHFGYA